MIPSLYFWLFYPDIVQHQDGLFGKAQGSNKARLMCGAMSRQVPFRKEKLRFRVVKKVPRVINVCFSGHFSCDIAQIHAACEGEKKSSPAQCWHDMRLMGPCGRSSVIWKDSYIWTESGTVFPECLWKESILLARVICELESTLPYIWWQTIVRAVRSTSPLSKH